MVIAMVKDGRLDDVEIKDSDVCIVCTTAQQVHKKFKVNDEDFEEKESARSEKLIMMHQQTCIRRLAEKFGLQKCKDVHTPVDSKSKLVKISDEEVFVPKFPYRELVVALMYVATCPRPDIAHAVGKSAKFCERYGKSLWEAVERILKHPR